MISEGSHEADICKETDMSGLYWLTDEQMARLELYFPKSHG